MNCPKCQVPMRTKPQNAPPPCIEHTCPRCGMVVRDLKPK